MTERLPEPPPQQAYYPPVEPTGPVAAKNVALGLTLFMLAVAIAAGAVVVSLIYLHYD